jgi:hypothetical protein
MASKLSVVQKKCLSVAQRHQSMEDETKQAIQAIGDVMFARADSLGINVDGNVEDGGVGGDGDGDGSRDNDGNEDKGNEGKADAKGAVSKASAVSGDASLKMGMLKFHQISYENASHGVVLYKDAFKRRVFR